MQLIFTHSRGGAATRPPRRSASPSRRLHGRGLPWSNPPLPPTLPRPTRACKRGAPQERRTRRRQDPRCHARDQCSTIITPVHASPGRVTGAVEAEAVPGPLSASENWADTAPKGPFVTTTSKDVHQPWARGTRSPRRRSWVCPAMQCKPA